MDMIQMDDEIIAFDIYSRIERMCQYLININKNIMISFIKTDIDLDIDYQDFFNRDYNNNCSYKTGMREFYNILFYKINWDTFELNNISQINSETIYSVSFDWDFIMCYNIICDGYVDRQLNILYAQLKSPYYSETAYRYL